MSSTPAADVADTKAFWQSKTFWINLLGIGAIVAQSFPAIGFIFAPEYQVMVLGVINVLLRFITKTEIVWLLMFAVLGAVSACAFVPPADYAFNKAAGQHFAKGYVPVKWETDKVEGFWKARCANIGGNWVKDAKGYGTMKCEKDLLAGL